MTDTGIKYKPKAYPFVTKKAQLSLAKIALTETLEKAKLANPIILKTQDLVKAYGEKAVVNGLSFNVGKGEVVGLLGPNGAGKTTAFYMTIGLIRPDEGQVFFQGKEITNLPIHKRAMMGMGYLAQEPSVFRHLTVEQNILCILETLPISKHERKCRLDLLLQELHLEKLAKKMACSLSGGERRRLEITRSLVTQPSLLLLDEPFANIDPLAVNDVKHMIRLLKSKEISILITDHNAREIFSIVDRSYLIREGKVMMSGSVDELLQSKEARTSYFGEDFRL
ncbi:MAG TPA: LPS export ABC transporter ATP-binding protein [Rhabdochlamydiaceae bacterium]|nr:LPS export ABC transporter ATP-binding protein [Rhabdochlamydiaceae bacterium]